MRYADSYQRRQNRVCRRITKMKIRDITVRAGRSLKQAKARTLLTSLAIGVGAFTIVLSLAVGAGGRAYTSNIISSNTNSRAIYTQAIQDFASDPTKPKKYSDTPTMSMGGGQGPSCLLYTSPSPRDGLLSRMPS